MEDNEVLADNHVDDHVDTEIQSYLTASPPISFFTFAGAGSGKTRSLVNALNFIQETRGANLAFCGQKVAVITYTNAACDEIQRRLKSGEIFAVSTIHSFLWELIRYYQRDIKEWVTQNLKDEIDELYQKQAKARRGNNSYAEKAGRKQERLDKLNRVRRFSYNPNGENVGYDSLNHEEVIKMGSCFIATKDTMQIILVSRYPILLIDESQDTKKELVDALLEVYARQKNNFLIGMFGDTMQRIYLDGKDNLASFVPPDWKKPIKVMNHRSGRRIVELANAIRTLGDGKRQQARSDAEEGVVRLFIVDSAADKQITESAIMRRMAEETGDKSWPDPNRHKTFTLEHHMAASRLGFSEMYAPLKAVDSLNTALLDGTIPELSLLSNRVLPLLRAYQNQLRFEISKLMRQFSPLLCKKSFADHPDNQVGQIWKAQQAVDALCSLWSGDGLPTCLQVLQKIKETQIFGTTERIDEILVAPAEESGDERVDALRKALRAPFSQLERYAAYIAGDTEFATHQGVKGLEFPHVMVILDDEEARGKNLFSYEKLLGAKDKSDTDRKNEREGKDTSITRTARLFYVACTRARKSLAVVAYTLDVNAAKATAISNEWFRDKEIILL